MAGTAPGGVALIGWSNGGSIALATALVAPDMPPGLFRRFAAFHPGCPSADDDLSWKPSAPMMILMGEDDDWTPAPPGLIPSIKSVRSVSPWSMPKPQDWQDIGRCWGIE